MPGVGGYRQHVKEYDSSKVAPVEPSANAGSSDDPTHSSLAFFLCHQVMWGFITTEMARTLASYAWQDGLRHQDLDKLRKIGTEGLNKQNLWRDLMRKVRVPSMERAVETVSVPVKGRDDKIGRANVDMLMPHALFSYIYDKHPNEFRDRILGGSPENITTFWASQERHPEFKDHPMHNHPRFCFRTRGVPYSLHGDGATVVRCGKTGSKSVDSLSWCSLLAKPCASWFINFIIVFIFSCCVVEELECGDPATMDIVWHRLCYSLYWMYHGLWPDRDFNGNLFTTGWRKLKALTPLAGDFFGILWITRADLDFLVKEYGLANWKKSLCILCRANGSTTPWTASTLDAGWIGEMWTNETYAHAFPNRHRLFRHVPGVGIRSYIPDVLHCKYLGSDAYFLGSLIWYLISSVMPGTLQGNLSSLFAELKQEYTNGGWQGFTKLTLGMIKGDGTKLAYLKGSGYQIRATGHAMLPICRKHFDCKNDQHGMMVWTLEQSIEIDNVLHEHRYEFSYPELASKRLLDASFGFCQGCTALIKHFHARDEALFHFTIKSHYIMHIALAGQYINPMLASCDSGEDMMKVVKRLLASASGGRTSMGACHVAMEKYIRGLSFDFVRNSKYWRS